MSAADQARIARLGDIAIMVRGITFKPEDLVPAGSEGSVGCMRTKNVQSELDMSDVWAVGASLVKRSEQYLQTGDVLVSSANSWNLVGKCCWIPSLDSPTTFGGFVSVLRPHSAEVDARYLYRWFSSSRTQQTIRSFGRQTTNISNLDINRTLDLTLHLPSLDEQRRVADVLERADGLRAKRRGAIALLDELVDSLFLNMFGDPVRNPKAWPRTLLGEKMVLQQYGPRFYNESYSPEGVRIVRITDLDDRGRLDFNSMPRMLVSDEERQKFTLNDGDIVFARTGATVGKLALIRTSDPECIAGAYFIRMRFDDDLVPEYVETLLRTKAIREIVVAGSYQSAQQNFSGPGLRSLPLLLPPLDLQKRFADTISAISVARTDHAKSANSLDELFETLQASAFSGNCRR